MRQLEAVHVGSARARARVQDRHADLGAQVRDLVLVVLAHGEGHRGHVARRQVGRVKLDPRRELDAIVELQAARARDRQERPRREQRRHVGEGAGRRVGRRLDRERQQREDLEDARVHVCAPNVARERVGVEGDGQAREGPAVERRVRLERPRRAAVCGREDPRLGRRRQLKGRGVERSRVRGAGEDDEAREEGDAHSK